MNTFILTRLVALMTAFASPNAEAAADGPGASRAQRGPGQGLCNKLACSDDQRAQVDAIRAEHREAVADVRARAKQIRSALQAERGSPSPDADRVAELRADLQTAKTELRKSRKEAGQEIATVLTPEQRERMKAMKAERKAERKADKRAGKRGKKGNKAKRRGRDAERRGEWARGPRDGRGSIHADGERGPGKAARGKRDGRGSIHDERGSDERRGKHAKRAERRNDSMKAERKGERRGKAHAKGNKRGPQAFTSRG